MRRQAFLEVLLVGLSTVALAPGPAGADSQRQNLAATLASDAAQRAAAVSGPIIQISPPYNDFGRLNVGGPGGNFDFTVTNLGAVDLHLTGYSETNPGSGFSVTLPSAPISPGFSDVMSVSYLAVGSGLASENILIASDDPLHSPIQLLVSAVANNPPSFSPALTPPYSATSFVPFTLMATATDPDLDVLTWSFSSVPPLPLGLSGPTFDTTTGTLEWTPDPADAGVYTITIDVTDGAATTSSGPMTLTVITTNHPPTADPGGPYFGLVGLGVDMTGAASSTSPDAGETLTYAWDFGDGSLGVGMSPSHSYEGPGGYTVSLTVTDDGTPTMSNTAITTVEVAPFVPATIVQGPPAALAGFIRTTGSGQQEFGIELSGRPVTDINESKIRLSTTYPNAGTAPYCGVSSHKDIKVGDLDGNLFGDLDFYVRASDLRPVLSHVPNGTLVTILVTARTVTDSMIVRGTIDLVKKGSSSVTAVAAPNPFKPETVISYSTEGSGVVSIRVFSVGGRLVRSLRDEFAAAGAHEVRWNGRDDSGRAVPSGIYFVSIRQGSDASTTRVVLAR